jgi:hypothetical protein
VLPRRGPLYYLHMGINFVIGCHRCEQRAWMYRGEESEPLHRFFRLHEGCARLDPQNVVVADDQLQEADWQHDYLDVSDDVGVQHPPTSEATPPSR